jgi:predicted PurR-regulated permease PerM
MSTPSPETETAVPSLERPRRGALSVLTRVAHPFRAGVVVSLGVLLTVVLAFAVARASTVLLSIVLAIFLALGLDPLVKWLERHRVSRGWAIATVFIVFALLVAAVVILVVPRAIAQVIELAAGVPGAMKEISQTDWFLTATSTIGADPKAVSDAVLGFFADPQKLLALSGGILSVAGGVAGAISSTFVIVVLTLYFLSTLDAMKKTFYRFTPAPSRPTVQRLTETITDSMGGFVITMIVLGACNAGIVFLLHWILGLPFPALMALLAFFLTLIPVVGSVLFWVVGTGIALFTSPTSALIFAIAYLIYMQVESYLLTPRLMGRTIAIPGILVLIGALIGAALLGLLGALVAVPITAAITLIVREVVLPRQDRAVPADI